MPCNNARNLLILAVCMFMLSTCKKDRTSEESRVYYYMNEKDISGTGMVYVYEPVSNPHLPTEYWHHRYDADFRGNFIRSSLYDATGQVTQAVVERIYPDVARLVSLELSFPTDTGMATIATKINQNEIFFFQPDSTFRATSQLEYWQTEGDSLRIILTKHRDYQGNITYPYQGDERPAIEVAVTEILETEQEGFTESKWTGREIYVQDIGLVYYKKAISDMLELEYQLVERMPFGEFQVGGR